MRRAVSPGAAVVVKVGSSSLARPGGGIDDRAIMRTAAQIGSLAADGHRPVLVSSGAVAAGLPALKMTERPTDLQGLQVAAAVGQSRLMERYTRAFDGHGLLVGQVLLTRDVLANRNQYLNARQALASMIERGVVPIVNENDTVGVDELRLGDNDRLAAIVGHLVDARLLVILTDTAGLFTTDPRVAEAELLPLVRHNDEILDELYRSGGQGALGSGGVATKIAAARMAAWSGIPTVIAMAADEEAVHGAVNGVEIGTWIDPQASRLSARKLWIAFGAPPAGRVTVDAGAVVALVDNGRSLLPAGVIGVDGDFEAGDAVEVLDEATALVAKGLTAMASPVLRDAAGRHSADVGGPVIHRDDLVVLRAPRG